MESSFQAKKAIDDIAMNVGQACGRSRANAELSRENQPTKTDVLEIEQLARAMSPDDLSTPLNISMTLADWSMKRSSVKWSKS